MNISYNKVITCKTICILTTNISYKNIIILWAIIIYQHHHINNFLDFSHGQRLHLVDKVVLSPFWDWNPRFISFLKGGSFGTWRCTPLLRSSLFGLYTPLLRSYQLWIVPLFWNCPLLRTSYNVIVLAKD